MKLVWKQKGSSEARIMETAIETVLETAVETLIETVIETGNRQ